MQTAFVLGAGKGTRLRPLTEEIPKPLVPVVHRPLVTFAFDHLRAAGIEEFVVNTHHCAGAWAEAFPEGVYFGHPVRLRFEPVLLETGGGIANVEDLLGGHPFLVYNGDILTDLPLQPAIERHANSDAVVTMILRSKGPAQHVAFDEKSGLVPDIHNILETGNASTHQFTGIYLCDPTLHEKLKGPTPHSVIGPFLELAKEGKLGGIVIDEGQWLDLGTRDAYLDAQRSVFAGAIRNFGELLNSAVHPNATVEPGAVVDDTSMIGPGAVVEAGARVEESVVWPGGRVIKGAHIKRCVVRTGRRAEGELTSKDI